jgi:hypothetical protein
MILCGTWSETSVAPSQLTQFWQIPRHGTLSYPVLAMSRHDCPLVVKPENAPWCLLPKQTWIDSPPIDMVLSAVFVLVVALLSLEVLEGLKNYTIYRGSCTGAGPPVIEINSF